MTLREIAKAILNAQDDEARQAAIKTLEGRLRAAEDGPADRQDDLDAALKEAVTAATEAEAESLLRAALRIPKPLAVSRPASKAKDSIPPPPVLWRDVDSQHAESILSVGEVAILSGEGGLGKSYFTLALGVAAIDAASRNASHGAACGLRTTPGPVQVVSYEDNLVRIYERLRRMGSEAAADNLHVADDLESLWIPIAGGGTGPSSRWDALWSYVRDVRARLVIIDPASAALADVSTTETGPVRHFLRALTSKAQQAECGVLIVAHDTKASRDAARRGDTPGAGVVAGSAAWYDGARGVLALNEAPDNPDMRILECVKANYGRRGWGALLTERTENGTFAGLELASDNDRLDNVRDWRQRRRQPPTDTKHKHASGYGGKTFKPGEVAP